MEPLKLELKGRALIIGCVELVVYFHYTQADAIQDFLDRALAALGDLATHYTAESMRRYAKMGSAMQSKLDTWLTRPRQGRSYWMDIRGSGPDDGCSDASLTMNYHPRQLLPLSADEKKQRHETNRKLYEVAKSKFMPAVTTLRVTLPLDHDLAKPAAFRQWIMNFQCIRSGLFAAGHAGLAINIDAAVFDAESRTAMQSQVAALLARHPGLNWEHLGSVTNHLLRYVSGQLEMVPRFKRVQWLTLLRNETLELCDSRVQVMEQLLRNKTVEIHAVDDGIVVQAGAKPQIGDVSKREFLPTYRHVAQVLAPARLAEHRGLGKQFSDEDAQEWLEAFERNYDGETDN